MPTVIATPGLGTSNSYITVAELDAYAAGRLHVAAWAAATTAQKEAAVIWATRVIDARVCFLGAAADAVQALAWPRTGLLTRNGFALASTVIPQQLKDATAEMALALLASDVTAESEQSVQGLKKLRAGPVELEFRELIEQKGIPETVKLMFVPGWLCPEAVPTIQFAAL